MRDHPLERIYGLKTCVYLMINGGKVIGGYAFPAGEGMAGAYYTLDGKTLEEVTGWTYPEWSERWEAKNGGG
ncbi:hypothetical protein J2T17_001638 [Paenibacillus mucilaginosus]|uniref:hypothetical protein n=1 Tax=Paenibacillus mucilaginosus TaxID=61624 RepID=UPI003D1CAF79